MNEQHRWCDGTLRENADWHKAHGNLRDGNVPRSKYRGEKKGVGISGVDTLLRSGVYKKEMVVT